MKYHFPVIAAVILLVMNACNNGTTIPMFIVHRKGLLMNGDNPALQYGYGGFNISMTPNFSIGRLLFLEQGVVYAVAKIREGVQYPAALAFRPITTTVSFLFF